MESVKMSVLGGGGESPYSGACDVEKPVVMSSPIPLCHSRDSSVILRKSEVDWMNGLDANLEHTDTHRYTDTLMLFLYMYKK